MRKAVIFLQLCCAVSFGNQQQGRPAKSDDRITGVITNVTVAKNGDGTITIESGTGRIQRKIVCTASTTIARKGKPVTLGQLKTKEKLDCIGELGSEHFAARSCTIR